MDKFFEDPNVGYALAIGFLIGIGIAGIYFDKRRWEKKHIAKKEEERNGFF